MRFIFAAWCVIMTFVCVQSAYESHKFLALVFGALAGVFAIAFVCAAFSDEFNRITNLDEE